ncbi:DUF7146 domain-containing protein [Methylobacterium nodulans]|uniref:Putative DNA primase n=1 Tax=Methylobacterium nodulans (strain LMG 21967 / CNCM I-2342 / ORS 2060) TaxID=460265 RepID=B8IDS7_METNO|nr:DNA primase [Methylobacterium nodulans]ACL55649.1 putative DNA primase [Methylobacterium nodulans ORS 2060]
MRTAAFDAWVEEARGVDLVAYARARSPRLHRSTTEWTGPCPGCGGRDRFGINVSKKLWSCRQGGGSPIGGDIIALVQHVEGCDFLAACAILTGRSAPGHEPETAEEATARRAAKAAREAEAAAKAKAEAEASARFREAERRRLYQLWRAAGPVAGSPAEAYLALRRVAAPPSAHLRCAPHHPLYAHGGRRAEVIHVGPALLAAILSPEGRFTGLHATWIDLTAPDGKLRLADPKTGECVPARKARGSIGGGRIELVRVPDPVRLVLGEGNETVLSAWGALRVHRPAFVEGCAFWGGVSLGNIAGRAADTVPHPTQTLTDRRGRTRPVRVGNGIPADDPGPAIPIPPTVTELWLCQDGDSDPFATRLAMERAARRYARPGLTIGIAPADPGQDFNDMLRSAA